MPTIDARGLLVIRIVYDGPALSGKTTSLRALADGVASTLHCPEERNGRTLYFDWMEYVGGLFEGRQISCQIVSVPGQHELSARRKLLLESADAVVCVLDTRRVELEHGLDWLREVLPWCRSESPPVGLVLQANKRDAHDAVPKEELRAQIGKVAPVAIVESVATASDGIREAFVLAVRLALDRVRALSLEGRLAEDEPKERTAEDLLRTMHAAETATEVKLAPPPQGAHALLHEPRVHGAIIDSEPPADVGDEPERLFEPDPLMPGGMIWPPVDGRMFLHEVAGLSVRPTRTARGDWWGSGAGWRFHSSPRALYLDHDAARADLIHWARLHSSSAEKISSGRVVILADAGAHRLRLWQLVRVEPVLRERLETALASADPKHTAQEVWEIAELLLEARSWFAQGAVPLPCTLWTVGGTRTPRPCFVGLMPDRAREQSTELEAETLLQRELAPHLRQLRRTRVDYGQVRADLLARTELARADATTYAMSKLLHTID